MRYTPQGSSLTYKLGMIHTPLIDWKRRSGITACRDRWRWNAAVTCPRRTSAWASTAPGTLIGSTCSRDLQRRELQRRRHPPRLGPAQGPDGSVSVRVSESDDASRVGGPSRDGLWTLREADDRRYPQPAPGTGYRISPKQFPRREYATTRDSATGGAKLPGSVASAFGVYHFSNSKAALGWRAWI